MGDTKGQAWITSVVCDGDVPNALVLAESLRRTKTTRRLAMITSSKVSKENRAVLRDVFDVIFPMDETLFPAGHHLSLEAQAKLHVFSLRLFDTCVFMTPTTLVLENADKLFDEDNDGKLSFVSAPPVNGQDEAFIDLSLFLFKPCLKLYKALVAKASTNGKTLSGKYLKAWFENQNGSAAASDTQLGHFENKFMVKFDTESGSLSNTDRTHAPIIQFLQRDTDLGHCLAEKMNGLRKSEFVGFAEKMIAEKWLEVYLEWATPLLKDPSRLAGAVDLAAERYQNEPIAIIGMSCRYPGANNLKDFWNLLYQGGDGVREPPAFRWVKEHSIHVTKEMRKTNASFLSCPIDQFDARFFGISPKEAPFMDPQARILHEVLWESLEDSGINPLSLYGTRTGIFTGSWLHDYKDIVHVSPEYEFFRTYMGNSIGAVAARLSHLLGLVGPSVATESACSSSVVAINLAMKSLRNGETNLAVAGGVNLILHPYEPAVMKFVISPDGRCKTFDAKADGYGRGEGCGVLVLKRLSDALRDRDNIWALIRGAGQTQEGVSRSLGTPTVHCESLAMRLALKDAGVRPEQVSLVEAHGTGTNVGDPMEVASIAKTYHTPLRKTPLIIGSVKTNVGHSESSSGVCGIMKTVLSLQHELIPKHLNLEELNPDIKLEDVPAVIPLEAIPWPKVPGTPRFAGVSSYGITGTDGHLIIQEAPDYQLPKFTLGLERPMHIMTVSGKSTEALTDLLQSYQNIFQERLSASGEDKLTADKFGDVAYSANTGRAHFPHRTFIVAEDYEGAVKAIQDKQYITGEFVGGNGSEKKFCFLFTGQGSQYLGMAKSLYETSPVFRINFDACDRTLREMYNLSIREVLWESDPSSKELSRTIYSQTSIFCVEYCLLKLWQSWGVQPDYVLGHSLGEFCAAVAAGVLDFKDALKLVAERSRLIDNLPRGSMLVVKACKSEVDDLLQSSQIDLDFAAVNSDDQTVVAGETGLIEKFRDYVKEKNMKCVILEATHAFHSRHMDPMLDQYRKVAQTIHYKQGNGNIQYISGLEGRLITDLSEMGPEYWVRHTREKVNFVKACQALREVDCQNYLEVGPQPVLSSFIMMNNEDIPVRCYPSLRRGTNEWDTILTSIGKLHLTGYPIDWKSFDEPYTRQKVSLPFHPFHRKPFWIESHGAGLVPIHPLIGRVLSNASQIAIFQNDLSVKSVPWLREHCFGTRMVFPGAGYAEMLLTAGYCVTNCLTETLEAPRRPLRVVNCKIDAPLELKEDRSTRLQCTVNLTPATEGEQNQDQGFAMRVARQAESDDGAGKWVQHCSGQFLTSFSRKETLARWQPDRIRELMKTGEELQPDGLYKAGENGGLYLGENFRVMTRHWSLKTSLGKDEYMDNVASEITLPADADKYLLHPRIIDAMYQSIVCMHYRYERQNRLAIPLGFGKFTLFVGGPDFKKELEGREERLYIHSWVENGKIHVSIGSLGEEDGNDKLFAMFEEMEMVETNGRTIESVLEQQVRAVPDSWEQIWKVIPGNSHGNPVELGEIDLIQGKDAQVAESGEQDLSRMVYLYTLKALYQVGWTPEKNDKFTVGDFCWRNGILTKFAKLVQFYLETVQVEEKGSLEWDEASSSWTVKNLPLSLEQVERELNSLKIAMATAKDAEVWTVYDNISKSLVSILKGEENPMAVLFPENKQNGLNDFQKLHPAYVEIQAKTLELIKQAIGQIHTRNGGDSSGIGGEKLRILEVGGEAAASGSITNAVMEHIRQVWGDGWEYTYTEGRAELLGAPVVEEDLKEHLKLGQFDTQECPLEQGIPLNHYDIVIVPSASHELNGSSNLQKSFGHLRQVLRENGVLCVAEVLSTPARELTFVWGLLDTFWGGEGDSEKTGRTTEPFVQESEWRQILTQCGFKSVQVARSRTTFGCVTAQASKVNYHEQVRRRGTWKVFATEKSPATQKIADILSSCGCKVVTIYKSGEVDNDSKENPSRITIRADNEDGSEMESLLGDGSSDGLQGVIYGWGMDLEETDQAKVSLPFMHVAKAILNMKKYPKLYVITQGINDITDDLIKYPTAATLAGMAKSLKNECFEVKVKCVDLQESEQDPDVLADQVIFEICMGMKEEQDHQRVQVAYRDGIRYEPKFVKAVLQNVGDELVLPPGTDRFHLAHPPTRLINDLTFEAVDQEELKENMVEIKTKAYSLNMKDIFTIVKPIPEFEKLHALGLDFAGIVTRVGPGVTIFQAGDRVFGSNSDSQMPSYMVMHEKGVMKVPDRMSTWEACTLPLVFSTAFYSLMPIANLKASDTVLIHTGAGGVGMCAVQIAKSIGATIITTAGSERKRAYLRSIGIEHVFHSRNTLYEQEIMRVTNGKGVDVVLNSLTGPSFKEATLRSCAPNARWAEISKITIWTPEEIKELRPDVAYTILDVTDLSLDTWKMMFDSMQDFLKTGFIQHIPFAVTDALNVRQALYYFQKAKHIGKLISVMPEVSLKNGQYQVTIPLFNEDSTYLITGGLGGIGFEVCKWMTERGATDIALVGRSSPAPDIEEQINGLRNKGFNVMVLQGDVGDYDQCKDIIAEIAQRNPNKPLRGVMHSAGVLRDNLYANQTWESFSTTYRSKITGTWNLHGLTSHLPLEHFVMYSSLTALIGTPGQPNHSSANCFEDAFAHYRWGMGLPATTVNWGQWAQVGCAKEATLTGVLPVSVKRMLKGLELLMKTPTRIQACFSEFESFSNLSLLCPQLKSYLDPRLWKQVTDNREGIQGLNGEEFWRELNACAGKQEKIGVISNYLKKILRSALKLEPNEPINDDQNIRDLGADSLMLMELKNSIQSLFGGKLLITANLLKGANTTRELSTAIANKLEEDEEEELMEPMERAALLELVDRDFKLDEDINGKGTELRAKSSSQIKTVLLTGATGFLGPHILAKLCDGRVCPGIEKIVCLIRGPEGLAPEDKLKNVLETMKLIDKVDMGRVECLKGDVTQKGFGLPENVYEDLCQTVDGVIHCATKSNPIEPYRLVENDKRTDIRSVGVLGTKNILRFASQGVIKHVYYSSIFSTSLGGEGTENDESSKQMSDKWASEGTLQIMVDNEAPGFAITKMVSELLLKQASEERGIPCKVFRFPWISGSSDEGRLDYTNNHYILRYLSYLKLKMMPDIVIPANILPVDICAELSLQLFFLDKASFDVFNVCHPCPTVEQEFGRVAKEEFGTELEIVELQRFTDMVQNTETPLGPLKDLYRRMEKAGNLFQPGSRTASYFTDSETFFKNGKVEALLPNYAEKIDMSMEIVKRDLTFLREQGVFKQFGL